MLIKIPKSWEIPESDATPEHIYWNRRQILAAAGFLGAGSLLPAAETSPYPAKRNGEFTLDRPITSEAAATSYNNFYEFDGANKGAVKNLVGKFVTRPWSVEITGLVNQPQTLDVDKLERTMPLEERLYRHRCVEAWSMAVPWTGFPLSELLKQADPKSQAKFCPLHQRQSPQTDARHRVPAVVFMAFFLKLCGWTKP